ncbi:TetR/AcrR family transcriptional regulator [Flavobacterium zepuense]|uniref:TetR/AcrR family transcriptional regulator n=1 Tax=Flavobacterium zepuense TaxID=2593302 RepID=A0A552V8C4_9FLAO|nr:TetR/AcrR family transcriptional regulator [Flavobacterium zepuense]TRW26717.1 TetR/AcrR family transcriptional regulator [Flavobacterium zepuense]
MKETILIKATEMFLSLGFKSVTMDDIAAELGISKKTIYQHFENKNDLVEATANHLFETISTGIDAICQIDQSPIQEFFVVRQYLQGVLKNDTASPDHQLQKFYPKIHACLRIKQFEKLHGCMLNNLERGVKEGLYRAGLNIEFAARIYFTGLTGIKDDEIFPKTMYNMETLTIQYLEYHLRGIVSERGLAELTKTIAENNFKKN